MFSLTTLSAPARSLSDLLNDRRHQPAGTAPGSPEVHQHGNLRLDDLGLEVVVGYFGDGAGHVSGSLGFFTSGYFKKYSAGSGWPSRARGLAYRVRDGRPHQHRDRRRRSTSSATCTSSTGQSFTASWPTATPPRRCATHRCRSRHCARQGRATELPGIGAIIQEKVLSLADDGAIPALAKLRAKFPPGLIEITRLPGLGPKRARRLFEELGIDSLGCPSRRPPRSSGSARSRASGPRPRRASSRD